MKDGKAKRKKMEKICSNCKWWNDEEYEWMGHRTCLCQEEGFFVGGGDENDGLYTKPDFGCILFSIKISINKEVENG